MQAEVLVIDVVGHGAVGRRGDKVDVAGEVIPMKLENFNHYLTGLIQVLTVNLDFDRGGVSLLITSAEGDPIGNKMNFEVKVFLLESTLDDDVNGIAAVKSWGHLANESSRANIVARRKSMGAEENTVVLEPLEKTGIELQVAKGLDRPEANKHTKRFVILGVASRGILETSKILLHNGSVGGDVAREHQSAMGCRRFDGKENVG
jgi:hypothetical protein